MGLLLGFIMVMMVIIIIISILRWAQSEQLVRGAGVTLVVAVCVAVVVVRCVVVVVVAVDVPVAVVVVGCGVAVVGCYCCGGGWFSSTALRAPLPQVKQSPITVHKTVAVCLLGAGSALLMSKSAIAPTKCSSMYLQCSCVNDRLSNSYCIMWIWVWPSKSAWCISLGKLDIVKAKCMDHLAASSGSHMRSITLYNIDKAVTTAGNPHVTH